MTKRLARLYSFLLKPLYWINGGLQRKLMLTYIVIIAVPLFLTSVMINHSVVRTVTEQTEQNNDKMLQLMSEQIDHLIMQIDRISYFVYLDDVQKMINQIPDDPVQHASWEIDLTYKLNSWVGFLGFNGGLRSVTLVNDERVYYHTKDVIPDKNNIINSWWYKEALSSDGMKIMLGPEDLEQSVPHTPYRKNSLNFGIARKVFNLRENKPLGVLVMGIEIYDMDRILKKLNIDSSTGLIITDKFQKVVYERGIRATDYKNYLLKSNRFTGDRQTDHKADPQVLVNIMKSTTTSWNYIAITDGDVLTAGAKKLNTQIFYIGMFGCILALLISIVFAKKIVIPLKRLQKSMKNIEKNHFRSQIPLQSTDEVGELTVTFNMMVARIHNLIHSVYKAGMKEKEANFNALQSQINPHFLYNTLDTINAMALVAENEEISRMVVALGEMFKYATQQKEKLVTVGEELAHLQNYITIQNCRYGDRISFYIDIPDEIQQYSMIRLILQPLVENAVRHGLEHLPEGGAVWISGSLENETIRLTIRDNGKGIPAEKLRSIQAKLLNDDYEDGSGKASIGLSNVNERVKLYFGEKYGVFIDSQFGNGTVVTIVIPAIVLDRYENYSSQVSRS